MNGFFRLLATIVLAAFAVPLAAQQEVPMRGNTPVAPQGIKIPPLPDAPVRYETAEGQNIRVSVYARGFQNPWSMAFVSDDTILVAERGGAIKAVRNGVVDPKPVPGAPVAIGAGLSGTDLALHPDFERNHAVYISYTKPLAPPPGAAPPAAPAAGRGGRGAAPMTTVAVAVAIWDGKGFTGTRDIFVGEGGSGGPIAFGGDGMLYVASGGGDTQNPKSLAGKILRLTDEGKVPPDNPFVGRADARPEVFTMGHRTFLRLAKHPLTGAIWQIENGPNGGDEVNELMPGRNYGWPVVGNGRFYLGPRVSVDPFRQNMEPPVAFWVPAIAPSGLAFYTGDRFPQWKNNLFVGGMRQGEVPRSGHLERFDFNDKWEELHREGMLRELQQRIRDVRQAPDGALYLLTAEDNGALLRIEPGS